MVKSSVSHLLKAFLLEEVDPESVDLSSFEMHDKLDRDFWNQPDDNLDPEIQEKLLIIANDFYDSLEVGDVPYEDVTFTGSLAAYNYSRFSDVDLHILLDFLYLFNLPCLQYLLKSII